jgi:hypothetical protein
MVKRLKLLPESKDGSKYRGRHLTVADYDRLISETTRGEVDGETKFLFLRGVIPNQIVDDVWNHFRHISFSAKNHSRSSLGAAKGGNITLGWTNRPRRRRLKPTKQYYAAVAPLLEQMATLIRKHLPDYFQ